MWNETQPSNVSQSSYRLGHNFSAWREVFTFSCTSCSFALMLCLIFFVANNDFKKI